jgi:hypothetical protein
MARMKDITAQAPSYMNTRFLDVVSMMDPSKTNKYTELIIKLLDKSPNRPYNLDEMLQDMKESYGVDLYNFVGLEIKHLTFMYSYLGSFSSSYIKTIMNFINACEKGQLKGVDVTKINSVDEIQDHMSLISLRNISKKLEKEVVKDYEDDEWLIVRPFTRESSLKYGYGSKWCTAMENNEEYFFNYTEKGKLIYCLNKTNGMKVAVNHNFKHEGKNDLSFWNREDERVDSMMCGLPFNILMEIKRLLEMDNNPNKMLNEKSWLDSYNFNRNRNEKNAIREIRLQGNTVVDNLHQGDDVSDFYYDPSEEIRVINEYDNVIRI